MEDNNGNAVVPHEEDYQRAFYRQQVRRFHELVNNNVERPDDMQWSLQRRKTIKTLKELREKLDIVCVGANYGKGVGSGAQLSGALTSIIGALLSLGNSSSAKTVMNVGSLINNSGAFVGGLSNIVESFASSGYLREIKAVLDKDKELSEPLYQWLTFSRDLDTNMNIIFGCDLNSAIRNNALKVFSEFTMLYHSTKGLHATLDLMKKGQYSLHIGTDVKIEKLAEFSKELDVFPEYRDTIIKFCSHLSEGHKLLQVAKDGLQVYKNLYGENPGNDQLSLVPDNANKVNTIHGDGEAMGATGNVPPGDEIPSVKAVSMFCGFQAIDIAVSIVSLISAVKVIRDGKSKFSDALQQISNLLEYELKSIEKLNE